MAGYHVFVDESGGFSFRRRKSFVGGFVCAHGAVDEVRKRLPAAVKAFNSWLKTSHPDQPQLVIPDHLHFMPLHLKCRRRNVDERIQIKPDVVPRFFRDFYLSVRPHVTNVFRSTGLPSLMSNDHACYIEVLRHTLLQLVDTQPLRDATEIHITVAHRRGYERYGLDAEGYETEYESHILDNLEKELREAFIGRGPKISTAFGDGRRDYSLIMADFFCGAMAWDQEDYLVGWNNMHTFPFAQGYRRVGQRLAQRLWDEYAHIDKVSATYRALEAAAANPEDRELGVLVTKMTTRLEDYERDLLCGEARRSLNDKLLNDPERYDHLDVLDAEIRLLRAILPMRPELMRSSERRLYSALLLNQVRIDSHRGLTDDAPFQRCLEFLNAYGPVTFDNVLELLQEKIEAVLSGVQLTFFNSWKFDAVEEHLASMVKTYDSIFKDQIKASGCVDANRARLDGTLGQMYAFLADVKKDPFLYEYAEFHLRRDVDSCLPGSPQWRQGMGYLTVLYWKMGDLDKAVKQFLAETETSPESQDFIWDLSRLDLFGGLNEPFLFLHRLNICALAQRKGREISGLPVAANEALQRGGLHTYPRFQIAKWLAVMLAVQQEHYAATKLLQQALGQGSDGIAALPHLPMKIILQTCAGSVRKPSTLELSMEIEALQRRHPHLIKNQSVFGMVRQWERNQMADIYEVAASLPFYYS